MASGSVRPTPVATNGIHGNGVPAQRPNITRDEDITRSGEVMDPSVINVIDSEADRTSTIEGQQQQQLLQHAIPITVEVYSI